MSFTHLDCAVEDSEASTASRGSRRNAASLILPGAQQLTCVASAGRIRAAYYVPGRRASQHLVESCGLPDYLGRNRTRQASVRKDMHTWRVFYFRRGSVYNI